VIIHGVLAEVGYKTFLTEIKQINQFDLHKGYTKPCAPIWVYPKTKYFPPRDEAGKATPMSHRGGAIYKSYMQERWR